MPLDIGLKTSVSLSSLPPGTPNDSPEHVRLRIRNDRPYHSLTKAHRRSDQSENWRKSWGSGISSDDKEFWTAFQADYEHLMSQTMVPEIINTPNTRQTPLVWNLEECLDRFAQLYSWLKRFNDSIYCKQGTDWVTRAKDELDRHRCRLDEFNNGASALIREFPHVKEEVTWRVRYVNDAWHGVETALATCDSADQLPRLRRWLAAMESKIKPVSFNHVWTGSQLEARRRETAVLQRDIEEHGRVIASVVRSTSGVDGICLERQYHNLLLRCFEWQYHIEGLLARQNDKSPASVVSSDSDGEPLAKCARYHHDNSDTDRLRRQYQKCSFGMDNGNDVVVRRRARAHSPSRRCGVAQFSESISSELDGMTSMAEISTSRPGRNIRSFEMKHLTSDSEDEEEKTKLSDDGRSSASEGWCFEQRKKKVVRSLEFPKAPSVQQLVEDADNLVRMLTKYPIESRDASGESDTDNCVKSRVKNRPLSLGVYTDALPPSGRKKLFASESALNVTTAEPARKRRVRPRRKFNSLRKNQSHWEEGGWTMEQPVTPPTIVKSESFSGVRDCSDSSTDSMTNHLESGDHTLVHDNESDDDLLATAPSFRFGPDDGAVTVADSEKIGGEEPSSLNTEDCWDSYQEKYLSEPYSEEVDDARNLLECDDYRQFLDSQSDTSRSTYRRRRVRQPRQQRLDSTDTEPEMEEEESTSFLDRSSSQFREVKTFFTGSAPYAIRYDELLQRCDKNIECLQQYFTAIRESRIFSNKRLTRLLDQWRQLRGDIQQKCEENEGEILRQEIEKLRCELLLLANGREDLSRKRFANRQQLDVQIATTKNDLNAVRERKIKVQYLNASVHRFACLCEKYAAPLKLDIAELYSLWEISFEGLSRELRDLQDVATKFDEFEKNMAQLQTAFRADRDTLRLVDQALKCGLTGAELAKVLYDKNLQEKCGTLLDDASLLLTEGSLSDSGISDSGSELEMSERERRLAALKSLARHLESVLEPGSHVLRQMMQSIEDAEIELRSLQSNCREMMARSVGCAEPSLQTILPKVSRPKGKRRKSGARAASSPSWFWRVVRAALPFQLALVALLCVACLLEPQCCDSVNNFAMGGNFRYVRGPPPV